MRSKEQSRGVAAYMCKQADANRSRCKYQWKEFSPFDRDPSPLGRLGCLSSVIFLRKGTVGANTVPAQGGSSFHFASCALYQLIFAPRIWALSFPRVLPMPFLTAR